MRFRGVRKNLLENEATQRFWMSRLHQYNNLGRLDPTSIIETNETVNENNRNAPRNSSTKRKQ